MTVTRPQPRILLGTHVSVEPLTEAHLAALWPALGMPAVKAGLLARLEGAAAPKATSRAAAVPEPRA